VTAGCCVAALAQMQLSDVPPEVSRLTIGVGVQMSLLLYAFCRRPRLPRFLIHDWEYWS
jgi:hypothetical protein